MRLRVDIGRPRRKFHNTKTFDKCFFLLENSNSHWNYNVDKSVSSSLKFWYQFVYFIQIDTREKYFKYKVKFLNGW